MKITLLSMSAALVLGLTCTNVSAGKYKGTFEELDTDANGYISKEEAMERSDVGRNYKRIDQDQDGQLSSGEFSAFEGEGKFSPPEESETPEPGAAPY